ncbi:MAG: histidinol dehydrogenase [Planctomycetes bacterium]|nr:histidinol dehydrogenase [Planctomycetota bacterium]
MTDKAIRVFEIGSDDFAAFQKRIAARAERGDVPLGGAPMEYLARARASGDGELIAWAEQFYEGLPSMAEATVERVIQRVAEQGDRALCMLTRLFDDFPLTQNRILVAPADLQKLAAQADPAALKTCKEDVLPRLKRFHARQKLESFDIEEAGGSVGSRVQPLQRVALYVPGGKAFYPSTLMMTAVPAQVAGVREIAVFTPPGALEKTPLMAALLLELGLTEVYRVGGAQAVAAAAFGTGKIPKVHKVVGPGNIFVALAKRLLYGQVDIDSIAGPSEIVVLFDRSAKPRHVAADLLAQAEHDEHAAAIGVTDDAAAAQAVQEEVEKQLTALPRKDIARSSLTSFGGLLVVPSMNFGVRFVDSLAPEHVEVITAHSEEHAAAIRHAGAIFIGPFAPEAFGDYCAGPNHVLPTSGTATWACALSVYDFVRHVSIIRGSREMLAASRKAITTLARTEGLEAHARSVDVRFE